MCQKHSIGRFNLHRPFWIFQVPFCQIKVPVHSSEEPFSRNILNQFFILDKLGGLIDLFNLFSILIIKFYLIYLPNDSSLRFMKSLLA